MHGDLDAVVLLFVGRYDTELARHKALDTIGDLALLFAPRGARFHGHIIAIKAGHGPHRQWVEACLAADALHLAS